MKTSRISSILYKVIYKIKRLLWLFFHPYLWKMDAQINGIPVIQGASVAKGCIVAAGSVVKGNLDKDNALYGGVPATFIRDLV